MGRRPRTAMTNERSNETDPAEDVAATSEATASGENAAAPVKQRRKRGPNKPKPGAFVVETQVHMTQEEIIKLLASHAAARLEAEVAERMTLQVRRADGSVQPLDQVLSAGDSLQFGTPNKT